ncbi:MAG: intradiol ring-cleavage dioxygenase, partial [Chloroflexota bacterium]
DHEETAVFIEGPDYTPTTPNKKSFLKDGVYGSLLVLGGQVVNTACQPIAGAVLDFWHCDAAGNYDNDGFKLRGHQFTDENGRWQLETILPAPYEGRPRHIHVKVQGANTSLLTTQLFFPEDVAAFKGSADFDESLVIAVAEQTAEKMTASFRFVLAQTA